ncbi:hypothetical protein AAG570_013260 [Ranatra chinensis]|uniref:Peptidase A2 domain-containing protein n=1 Tax=Ranatra chinensis TaxID=642074 RepID=A0ABD0YGD7_9HEMI
MRIPQRAQYLPSASTRRGRCRSMSKRESDASDSASSSASDRSSGAFSSGNEGLAARRRTYAVVTAQQRHRRRVRMAVAGGKEQLTIADHQCTGWDAKVLVDTGSTHTAVHTDADRALGCLGAVTPYSCEAATVAGITAIGGELALYLQPISGLKRTVQAHVLDWGPQNYQVILGADAMRSLGARVVGGSKWGIGASVRLQCPVAARTMWGQQS